MAEGGVINPELTCTGTSETNEPRQGQPGASSDNMPINTCSRQGIFHMLAGISPLKSNNDQQDGQATDKSGTYVHKGLSISGLNSTASGSGIKRTVTLDDARTTLSETSGTSVDPTWASLPTGLPLAAGSNMAAPSLLANMAAPTLNTQHPYFLSMLYDQCKQNTSLYQQQQATLEQLTATMTEFVKKSAFRSSNENYSHSSDDESVSQYDNVSSEEDNVSDSEPGPVKKKLKSDDVVPPVVSNNKLSKLKERESVFTKVAEYGTMVHPGVASIVNKALSEPVDHKSQTVKDLTEKYHRPENCSYLDVPSVNKVLWKNRQTSRDLKQTDRNLQRTQTYLTKGMIPLVELLNKTTQSPTEESQELFYLALDAFSLLAYAHSDFSCQRRRLLQPAISSRYAELCDESASFSSPTLLFGEDKDIEKRMKDIDDSKKLGKSFMPQAIMGKFTKPGSKQPWKSSRDFLGKRPNPYKTGSLQQTNHPKTNRGRGAQGQKKSAHYRK